jgi:DNA repair exonuclease SbcCD ATPase subunit
VKHINFQKIYIQNFLSVGNPGITLLFQEGINLITGLNLDKDSRNGVGKSTLIESLYWCLFGETIRDLKKEQIVNNINKKNCLVSLEFNIVSAESNNSYSIVREAKPSKISITENGVDITKSTIAKADNYIEHLISSTRDVFQNAVIMTANNTIPFMAQKKGEKRKFIEDMLRLGVFGEMSLQARSDQADTKRMYEIVFDKNQTHLNNINIYQEQHNKQQVDKQERIIKLQQRLELNKQELESLSTSIKNIDEKIFNNIKDENISLPLKIKSLKDELKIFTKTEHELEFNIKQLDIDIDKLQNTGNTCPACNRQYDADHIHTAEEDLKKFNENKKNLERKLNKLKDIVKDTNKEIFNQEQKLTSNKDTIHKITLDLSENKNIESKINQLHIWNKQLTTDISCIGKEDNNFFELLQKTQEEQKITEQEVNINNYKLKIIDTARFVISEEGVKSFIVKKMLQLLNSKLNFYLQKLEAPCRCYFNEFFEEIIVNERGEECSYFNFSGGESKRIDLAVLFMFQDIRRLQSDVKINISMYDELFDSALDERGAESVLNLLKERVQSNKEAIYIISHNKDAVRSGINNIIQLQKQNGITTIV